LEELGRGGMGRVFKVEHTLTRRLEAMKVLEGGRPNAPGQATRSLREIQVQAGLDHPNIAAVHHAFCSGDDLVLVMELIDGCSLRRLIEGGPLPLPAALDYACQALAALDYAHAHGVIHRDISPSNMMVSSTGVLKITDFGLSKGPNDVQLSQPGAPIGSLYYMSPEQVRGAAQITGQSDLYSFGAVLYELVTGRRPFDGESAFALMMAHVEELPVPPMEIGAAVPALLNDAILRALAKDPAERFSTAEEFRQTLLQVKPTRLHRKSPSLRLPHIPHLNRSWLAGTAAACAVLTIGVAGLVRNRQHPLADPVPAAITDTAPQATEIRPVTPALDEHQAAKHKAKLESGPIKSVSSKKLAANVPAKSALPGAPQLLPSPTVSNTMMRPAEEHTFHPPPDPPQVASEPVPTPPALPEVEAAAPQVPSFAETDATPKPNPNGLKKGLGRFWRIMRMRKASEDAPAGESGRQ